MVLTEQSPKKIYKGSTEIKAVYLWENKVRPPFKPAQESIVIKLTANSSWTLYIAKAWYGADWNFWASYKWNISVDGWQSSYYNWSSSNGWVISLSWYTANTDYIVTITPSTESYWWARAFWWKTVSSTYKNLFKEVLYDWSYMWYATSATNTGNRFRISQYYWTALTKAPDEYIPNTVTTIWSDFRADQYYWCTGLLSSPDEYIPNSVTSIWGNFRSEQYYWCNHLISSWEEALPNTVTSIWGSFRQYQYHSCALLENVKWWKDLSIGNSSLYRYRQFYSTKPSGLVVKVLSDVWYASYSNQTLQDYYVSQVQVPSAYLNNFINSTKQPRVNITDSKFVWY